MTYDDTHEKTAQENRNFRHRNADGRSRRHSRQKLYHFFTKFYRFLRVQVFRVAFCHFLSLFVAFWRFWHRCLGARRESGGPRGGSAKDDHSVAAAATTDAGRKKRKKCRNTKSSVCSSFVLSQLILCQENKELRGRSTDKIIFRLDGQRGEAFTRKVF